MFPAIMAPVTLVFGVNFYAFKVEIIVIFMLCLLVSFWMFRRDLLETNSLFIVLMVGFHPLYWEVKDGVTSGFPFLLLTYLSLFFMRQAHTLHSPSKRIRRCLIFSYIFIVLSIGTRYIGVVLVPVYLVSGLVNRKYSEIGIFLTVVAIIGLSMVTFSDLYLIEYLSDLWVWQGMVGALYEHFGFHLAEFSHFWHNGYSDTAGILAFCVLGSLALVGYVTRIEKGVSAYEIFFLIYTISVIIALPEEPLYPGYVSRYYIPALPLFVFYFLVGVERVGSFLAGLQGIDTVARIGYAFHALPIAVVFISYA